MTSPALVERSISLFYVGGTSNKEYHLYQCKHPDGTYSVHAEYGPRGNPNRTDDKTKDGRVSRFRASEIFNDIEKEKRTQSGYRDLPRLRTPTKVPRSPVGASAPRPVIKPATTTPAPAPQHTQLAASLAAFMTAQPAVASAGADALKVLSARVGLSKVRALSLDVKNLLKALLGDIACNAQDYVDDALATANKALTAGGTPDQLLAHLSPEASAAIESARVLSAPGCSSNQFVNTALAPVTRCGLF